ncbi:hypothetical protein Pcinc_024569 [Petrolisthes cinctipes]|uniref:Uncharacterized protein n=1 Tax=Petrolisthes cinctipes TaxID=88211 RepID=A0AAE1FBS3_PETCI|nr:hypothetical protein Pcinc_024569 [Petrolisthes cinctipes]
MLLSTTTLLPSTRGGSDHDSTRSRKRERSSQRKSKSPFKRHRHSLSTTARSRSPKRSSSNSETLKINDICRIIEEIVSGLFTNNKPDIPTQAPQQSREQLLAEPDISLEQLAPVPLDEWVNSLSQSDATEMAAEMSDPR